MGNVRDGDIRALAQLFERHHVGLFNFYLRLTGKRQISEDMVQEVFFRMLKYRHTYQGEGEFAAWMYQLARNVRKDHHRKWRLEPTSGVELPELAAEEPHAHELLEQQQDNELLQRALAALPAEKREVLILSRYQDLRYDAIAEILGCSVEAVKVRVHRAMKDLRKAYFRLAGEHSR